MTENGGETDASATQTVDVTSNTPTVSLANAIQTVNENGGSFTVTVNLSAASGVATTVPFTLGGTAVNGVNYSGVTTSPIVIPAGQTSATITGTLIDDGKYEPTNSTLIVTLGTPTNATPGATTSDTVTIVESDPEPTVSLANAIQTVNENGGSFTVTVNLSAASGVATTVPFTLGGTAVNGVNYSGVTSSPIVIAAGQTSATITGTLIDDGKYEPTNKTLTVTLGTPTNATLGTTTSDTVTIVESDPQPTVSLANAIQTVNENGGSFTVTVNLSAASGVATTVPFTLGGTAVNGVNYSGVTTSPIVIPAGQTSATITGTLIDDGKYEPTNSTLIVTLGTPTGATLGATSSDTVTIVETDLPLTAVIAAVSSPRDTAVPSMTITFKRAGHWILLGQFAAQFQRRRNLLTGAQTLTTSDNTTWTLGNLTSTTGTSGNYVLTLSTPGIQDAYGNVLAADVSIGFTVNTVAPTAAITPVSPNPRNTAVDTVTITFSEPVSGFALSNLQLTLGGGANLLTSAQTLTTTDNTTWTLGNLAGLTAASGTYALTLSPTGIFDAAGNAQLAGTVSTFAVHTWQNARNNLDVNNDGKVSPIDALLVINYLNQHGAGPLPPTYAGPYYLDVNGDSAVTPLDALEVINYLNANVVSGVAGGATVSNAAIDSPVLSNAGSSRPAADATTGTWQAADEIAAAGISFGALPAPSAGNPSGSLLARFGAGVVLGQPQIATTSGAASGTTSAAGNVLVSPAAVDSYFAGSRRWTDPTPQAEAVDVVLSDSRHWAA